MGAKKLACWLNELNNKLFDMNDINPLKQKLLSLTIALCSGLGVCSAYGAMTSMQDIERVVTHKVDAELKRQHISDQSNQRVSFRVHSIDPRLQLVRCSQALEADIQGTRLIGKISAKVSCRGNQPWSVYVPVSILIYKKVVTARAPLARGALLTNKHLQLTEVEISSLNQGYLNAVHLATGKQLKRSIRLNDVVKPNMLIEPKIISRGDDLTIFASSGALEVRSTGVALTDGKMGQQIRVKNKASKKIISATVISKGVVRVAL